MTRFLVEAYTPATTEIADVATRVRSAADQLAQAGTDIHYVRAIFVPEDELCLHLLDAASIEAANELFKQTGISPDRIVEAVAEGTGSEGEPG